MAISDHIDLNVPAIVCLDASGEIWNKIRVALEEQQIASEYILMRTAKNAAEVLALCRRLMPALLVVVEESLPQAPLSGLKGLSRQTGVQLLVLSEKTDHASLEQFLRQGCAGVVSFGAPNDTLLSAVRSIFAGEFWFPRRVLSQVARDAYLRGPTPRLTPRELDILRMISLGHTNQQIADRFFISRETVRWHIRSLYDKIGAENREDAKREARVHLEAQEGSLQLECE